MKYKVFFPQAGGSNRTGDGFINGNSAVEAIQSVMTPAEGDRFIVIEAKNDGSIDRTEAYVIEYRLIPRRI